MSADSHTTVPAQRTLELPIADMQALVDAAMKRIVAHIGSLPDQPSHDLHDAERFTRSLVEAAPEEGANLDDILDHLFDTVIPRSLTTAGPGFMAYVPGGGIFHAAVADLIANATNRYVGAWMPGPGVSRIEANVVDWLAAVVGYGPGSGGFLTSGGSLANFSAIVAARHARLGEDFFRGTVYASDQIHHSVLKAVRMAGFPAANTRTVPTDARWRIDVDRLEDAMAADRAAGMIPAIVVGSAGTTNTGAVDDLARLADVATRQQAWFHVDGAYGGCFALTPRGRAVLRGLERADSITLDPHKGMFLPYGTGALLVKDTGTLRAAHSASADYLPELQSDPALVDFCEISPELSRDFRGLRIWLPVKMHGFGVFRASLNEKLDLAAWAAERIGAIPGVGVVAPPQLSIFAFRVTDSALDTAALNDLNRRFLDAINDRRRVYLTGTMLAGEFVLRMCVLSFRTHQDRVAMALEDIAAAAALVRS